MFLDISRHILRGRRVVLTDDGDRNCRGRGCERTIGDGVGESVLRRFPGLQANERTVRIVAEGAVAVVGDFALRRIDGGIDREAVRVADIRIGVGRSNRLGRPMFLDISRHILRGRRVVLANDGDRDRRGRGGERAISDGVSELVLCRFPGLQANERTVRIVAEGAVAVVGDLTLRRVDGGVDREAVRVADIGIGVGRRDRLGRPMFLDISRDILSRGRLVLTSRDGDRNRCG